MTTDTTRFVIAIFFVISASIVMILIFVRSLIKTSVELRDKNNLLKNQHLQLLSHQNLLQELMERTAEQEDEQRRQFAELLHDDIGHQLTLTIIKLTELNRIVHQYSLADIKKCLESQRSALNKLLENVRSLTGQISPQLLYQFGLKMALEEFAATINRDHSCNIQISGQMDELPNGHPVMNLIYKITRELLVNAVKHADASDIDVQLETNHAWLQITVSDNGKGFDDIDKIHKNNNEFGLLNIYNRLAYYHGTMQIENNAGGGARITIRLPKQFIQQEKYEHRRVAG